VAKEELKSQMAATAIEVQQFAVNEYDEQFRDSWQRGVDGDVLILEATRPQYTEKGLRKYGRRIKLIIRQLVGFEPREIRVVALEKRESGG
jgi:hypothetical protein